MPAVVVHQMGKVGSTSVFHALQRCEGIEVFQTHVLTGTRQLQLRHEIHGEIIRKALREADRPLRFISGVRDPMARNISAFFQNLPRTVTTFEQARDRFLASEEHLVTRDWFDQQVKTPLGIDVFEKPANFDDGAFLAADNFLIYRVEDRQAHREQAIARYLGLDDFSLVSANVGKRKSYAALYREFKTRFQPTKAFVEATYATTYVRRFYPESWSEMRAYWLERAV